MERNHAIIIIKNEENKYLQYYDNRWESYLFPNCKINDKTDYDKIKEEIFGKYGIKINNINYKMEKVHTKFSESDKIQKTYHHYFYKCKIEKEFENRKIQFKWYSMEELLRDERIQMVNSDIVKYVKECDSKNNS